MAGATKTATSAKKLPVTPSSLMPLVAEAGICLDNRHPAQLPTSDSVDEIYFTRCFRLVWFSLPENVRGCFLAHWRFRMLEDVLPIRPHIWIAADDILGNFRGVSYAAGNKLAFHAALTTSLRDMLPFVIAHELGHAYRMATGAFDLLCQSEVDDALKRWERGQRSAISDEARAAKKRQLDRRWRVREEEETDRIAAHWGFEWAGQPRELRSEGEIERLGERLRADDALHKAPMQPDDVEPDDEPVIERPIPSTRLDFLPKGHTARQHLRERGFDPDRLGGYYQVSFSENGDDPLACRRIIIPIQLNGRLRGWEAMSLEHAVENGMYLPALGMNRSRLLYNCDKARQYRTTVIVKEPTDVWSFGPMAVSLLGDRVTEFQRRLLVAMIRLRTAVLLLPKAKIRRSDIRELETALRHALPGRFAIVEAPYDLPKGTEGRKLLRAHVIKESKAQEVQVSYAKHL